MEQRKEREKNEGENENYHPNFLADQYYLATI